MKRIGGTFLANPMGMKKTRTSAFVLALVAAVAEAAGQERQIEVAPGEQLHVVDSGAGEPVVFVPGLLGSAFGFRKVIAPLVERGHRVIVVEPLGFGGSSTPVGPDYSLTAQADRVAIALETMGVEQAVVVGHGVGASVALRLAARHPVLVKAIVSLDGGPAEAAATAGLRRAMRFAFLIKLFGSEGGLRRAVRSTLRECSADPGWVTDAVVDGYMAAHDVDSTVDAFRQMAKAREPEALVPRLAEVRCPVHLVFGEAAREKGISREEIHLLAEGLASFSVQSVPHAGHFLFEEAPEAVLAAVDRAFTVTHADGASVSGPRH